MREHAPNTLAVSVMDRGFDCWPVLREVNGPQAASLSWMLLTTEPVDTLEQMIEVVRGYTLRWRIEEMHRISKRGGCNVEDTQLRSRDAIEKWAILHCAVVTRALRLSQLARCASC